MTLTGHTSSTTPRTYWLRVALWCLLFLVLLEVVSRSFIFKAPIRLLDPLWGPVPPEGSCYVRGTEGFGVTCYAANGEIATPFRDGISIVILGDSYTDALQVSNDDKYVSLAEVTLRERGKMVDLHNLGDSGNILADYVYLAPAVMETYNPAVVVLQTNAAGMRDILNPRRENYFAVNEQGGIDFVHRSTAGADALYRNAVLSSGLLTYTVYRWDNLKNLSSKKADRSAPEPATDDQILGALQLLSDAYPSSQIVLLIMPNVPGISSDELTWTNTDELYLLAALASIPDLTVIYPAQAFYDLYEQRNVFPRGFNNTYPNNGHLNQFGHIAVAGALADVLEAILP